MTTRDTLPFDFIQRHYRQPRATDPLRRWLPHPAVARAICSALGAAGVPRCDFEDALQDVYVRALDAFRGGTPVPGDLRAMAVYCAALAKNHAIDARRRVATRERTFVDLCDEPDEHGPLEHGAGPREPVDARRQLEVLAQLFREGRMPEYGLEILEGVACRWAHDEIAQELGLSTDTVEGRVRMMRNRFRARLAKLGLLPGMLPLEIVVSMPAAVERLRKAA